MHHHNHSGSWKQLPLAFDPNADLESTSVLRTAYSRLKLARRLTFEQVMTDRALAIGVLHLADAIARRQAPGIPTDTESAPTIEEIAKGMDPVFELSPGIDHFGTDRGGR